MVEAEGVAGAATGSVVQAIRCSSGLPDRGIYSSATQIAEAERISKNYVSRILRLALLAPDLVEAILGGWADQRVMMEHLNVRCQWSRRSSIFCSMLCRGRLS